MKPTARLASQRARSFGKFYDAHDFFSSLDMLVASRLRELAE
jgi:hypothetical protein